MQASPPSLFLLATEPVRAALEYAQMRFTQNDTLPRVRDHPVVIFPGLATDSRFTAPLAKHCRSLGCTTYDWGRGYNRGPQGHVTRWLDALAKDVERLIAPHDAPATLIGWSLGGIYAREIAKRLPHRVRQVITIGTPVAGGAEQTHATWLYRLLNGRSPKVGARLLRELRTPPLCPTTSIYSRSDGIVAWQACQHPPAGNVENIEVQSSHLGLVWHREVLSIIADRLTAAPSKVSADIKAAH